MRNKIQLAALFVVLLGITFVRQQAAYPKGWDEVQLGMTRQEVYDRTGIPTADTRDIKGAFWFENNLTQRHELWVFFEDDRVTDYAVNQYIGTTDHFFNRGVRGDSIRIPQSK